MFKNFGEFLFFTALIRQNRINHQSLSDKDDRGANYIYGCGCLIVIIFAIFTSCVF